MGNQHDRLIKLGIVALAGIAVLGWVREPERHQSYESPVSAASPARSESRATFYPQAPESPVIGVMGTNDPESTHATDRVREPTFDHSAAIVFERRRSSPVQSERPTSRVMKTPERPIANTGRHQDPQTVYPVAARSSEPKKEHSEDPGQGALTPVPSVDRTDDTHAQTQPVVGKKERSTAKSAAIIIGSAVAGAAIGAVAGGGKGATNRRD